MRRRLAMFALAFGALAALGACHGEETESADAGPSCPNDLPTACPTPAPSYSSDVAPIVKERCLLCHGPGGPQASVPLADYASIHARRTTVLTQVYGCRMPPAGAAELTSDERATLLAWLVCGAPDN